MIPMLSSNVQPLSSCSQESALLVLKLYLLPEVPVLDTSLLESVIDSFFILCTIQQVSALEVSRV